MRLALIVMAAAAALVLAPSPARAGCTLDHIAVGQAGGTLVMDAGQVYRHWNADWGVPNTGQTWYEWVDAGWGHTSDEPGFALMEPNPFPGTPLVDYHIQVERISATPGLEIIADPWTVVLAADGDRLSLSDWPDHHVHMRYNVYNSPDEAYALTFRLVDTVGPYLPSEPFTVVFGAPLPEPATLALAALGALGVILRRRRT